MRALELRRCPACEAPTRARGESCPECRAELPESGLPAAFPRGEVYLRPAPGALVALRELSWLSAVIVPWLALALALCVLEPAAWLERQGIGPGPGLLIEPRPFHTLAGWANCVAGFALVIVLGWRWQRAELPRPAARERWRSGLLLVGLLPAGVVVLAASSSGLFLAGVPLWIQDSVPASALTGTALGLALALALAPLLVHLALTRWLGARFGAVEVLGDQVAWRCADGRGLRVAAKRDLGARRVTPRGVRVQAPGGGFLLPTRGEAEQRAALAALDDFDPGADDVALGREGSRFLPRLTLAIVLVPALFAASHLGLAWAPPALASSLFLQAFAWSLAARWSDACLDAPRVHLGREGLLAARWLPWDAIRRATRVEDALWLEVGERGEGEGRSRGLRPGRYVLDLSGWPRERQEELAERVGGVERRAAGAPERGRRRQLGSALCLSGALLALTLGVIARPPLSPRVSTSERDFPGNRWRVVARLGRLDELTIVSPAEDPELPGGHAPGLPQAGVVVVAGDPPRVLDQRPRPIPGLGRTLWWHALTAKPGRFPASIFLSGDEPLARGIREGRTAVAYGQLHHVSSEGVKQTLQWQAVRGEVGAVWLKEPRGRKLGPRPREPSERLVWQGNRGLCVSFPGEPPALEQILQARDRAWQGLPIEEAAFPFWRHAKPPGCSRAALRSAAQLLYGVGRRRAWGAVPPEVRQQLGDLSKGPFPFNWILEKLTPAQRQELEPHLLPYQRELIESPDERQQLTGLRSLGRRALGLDAETWAAARRLIPSPSERVRLGLVAAALRLASLQPEPAFGVLEQLLADPEELVRYEAAEALGFAVGWQRPALRRRAVELLQGLLRERAADPAESISRALLALSQVAAPAEAWEPFFDHSLRANSSLRVTANTLIGDRLAKGGDPAAARAAYERACARYEPPPGARARAEKVLRRYGQ